MRPSLMHTISTVRFGLTVTLLVWLGGAGVSLNAQTAASQDGATSDILAAEDLGISLARIQNRLDTLPSDPNARSILRLNYYVQVYGRTPPLDLFLDFDIHNAPIPYGAPVHNELLAVMHSNPLYPSAVSLNPIAGWAWKSLRP